ncbi:MAG: glycosyltransferase [Planctomycetota bacterium]|nr:glycosyltransferase [Planctomycetota bacterium]
MSTRLGVVIPCLDEAVNLPRLLGRLREEGVDLVVVVDGGSEDDSCEIAIQAGADLCRAKRGRGLQLQVGAERAIELGAGRLWFLHADNLPAPGSVQAIADAFAQSPTAAAFGCSQVVEAEGKFYRLVEAKADQRVARGLVYGDSGLCISVAKYQAAGGFRPISLFEDLDLSRRVSSLGAIHLVPEAKVFVNPRRWRGEGALRTTVRNWILTRAWRLGVSPERLVRFYPAHKPTKSSPN